jgi:hypothetical protein
MRSKNLIKKKKEIAPLLMLLAQVATSIQTQNRMECPGVEPIMLEICQTSNQMPMVMPLTPQS